MIDEKVMRLRVRPGHFTDAMSEPLLARPLVFTNVTVVNVETGHLVPDQVIVVIGDRIHTMGRRATVQFPAGAEIVDGRGKYVIPGLWDMHVHARDDQDFFFPLLIATGVTGIRDVNQRLDTVRQWRQEIAAGQRVGPRIVATGFDLISTNDRAAYRVGWISATLGNPAEARAKVAELKVLGADFVKAHGDFMPRDVYFAVAAEARRLGIPLVGHVPRTVALREASDSGHRSIEHAIHFQNSCPGQPPGSPRTTLSDSLARQCEAIVAPLARNGTWLTPTLAYLDVGLIPTGMERYWPRTESRSRTSADVLRSKLREALDIVSAAHRAGMPMLVGTDLRLEIPASVHRELELLVLAGLTPLQAIQAATLNPAKFLGAGDSLGTIAPGKMADFVLLDANPLADISNTRAIHAIIANGRYFDRVALDAILAHQEALATSERTAYLRRQEDATGRRAAKVKP